MLLAACARRSGRRRVLGFRGLSKRCNTLEKENQGGCESTSNRRQQRPNRLGFHAPTPPSSSGILVLLGPSSCPVIRADKVGGRVASWFCRYQQDSGAVSENAGGHRCHVLRQRTGVGHVVSPQSLLRQSRLHAQDMAETTPSLAGRVDVVLALI